MARNEASGLWGDYGYDEEQGCWWVSDERGRQFALSLRKSPLPTLRREESLLRGFSHCLSILTLSRFTMAKPHQEQAVMQ